MDFIALVTRFQHLLKPNKRQKTSENSNYSSSESIPWYNLYQQAFFFFLFSFFFFLFSFLLLSLLFNLLILYDRNWVCSSLITVLEKYASGATEAIILSELQTKVHLFLAFIPSHSNFIKWDETPKDWNDSVETSTDNSL